MHVLINTDSKKCGSTYARSEIDLLSGEGEHKFLDRCNSYTRGVVAHVNTNR